MPCTENQSDSLQTLLVDRALSVFTEESKIDPSYPVYLITWSPDPKGLPDADFYYQHNFNVYTLVQYLKCCSCGIWCVESTQLGNPHYHGWYQVNDSTEVARIAVVKCMQNWGRVDIKKSKHYRVNSYKQGSNSLHYYKKDMVDAMLSIQPNPILSTTESTVDFKMTDYLAIFSNPQIAKGLRSAAEMYQDREYTRKKYFDTIGFLNDA